MTIRPSYLPHSRTIFCVMSTLLLVASGEGLLRPTACRGAEYAASPVTIELELAESWPIDHQTHHVQGLAATDQMFWISSVDRAAKRGFVYRVDRGSLKVVVERNVTEGAQIHPGGMQLVGDELWVALAEYRPRSRGAVLRLDPTTLAELGSFTVEDHIGAVATDGRERVYAVNWDSRTIYTFERSGKLITEAPNPTNVAWQDIEWHDGRLWCLGQTKIDGQQRGVIDVLDVDGWKPLRRYVLAGQPKSVRSTFGREGFTRLGESILVLPEDGPHSTVYRFPLPAE